MNARLPFRSSLALRASGGMAPGGHHPPAFSLVEVTLALGIIGFALVAVLGLLGVGINASRDNADDTVMGLVAQDIGNRVRAELASVGPPTDASGGTLQTGTSDFRWNAYFTTRPGYGNVVPANGATIPPDPGASGPGATANAYYTREGVFVREALGNDGDTPPPPAVSNYYKAAVYINRLPDAAYQSMNLVPANTTISNGDYPLLAVTVNVGWPAQPKKDGAVLGPAASQAKATFTFFLSKP